jgi:3D (Asp-Asp-Asp) domain-containing protein
MKNIIIKSGGYYETPGVSVAGAISDAHPFDIGQFHKTEMMFRLDLIDGKYQIYMPSMAPHGRGLSKLVDLDFLTRKAEERGFAYFGVVSGDKAVLTNADMLRLMTTVTVGANGEFVDATTGNMIPGNNIIPLLYCVKMTTDTYVVVLGSLIRVDTILANDEDGIIVANDGFNTVVVNDGASMRGQFVDIKFDGVRKAFRNNDLITGYAIYAERGSIVSIDLFKNAPFVTSALKDALTPSVSSNFEVDVDKEHNVFMMLPSEPDVMHGWLSVELPVTPLYKEMSSREIKEMITLDFMVFVL